MQYGIVQGPGSFYHRYAFYIHIDLDLHAHMHVQDAVQKRETYPRIIDMLGLTARSTGQDMSGKAG